MTKNKETKHHIYRKHKTEMEKTALANWIIYTLIWYAFYDLQEMEWALFLEPWSPHGANVDNKKSRLD